MREVTRNTLVAIAAVLALLLALGALPTYLQSGDPYYLTATPTEESHAAVNAANISDRRYPYTTAALANASPTEAGRSAAYYRGPFGLKGAFTHSPFDELDALRVQHPDTVTNGTAYVVDNGTRYELTVGHPKEEA